MKSHARVKDILINYNSNGIKGVIRYLNNENIIVEENTWESKIKNLLESKQIASVEAEIASLLHTFKL